MKLILALLALFSHDPMIREIACVSEVKCTNGACATKWVCPFGIVYVTPKE